MIRNPAPPPDDDRLLSGRVDVVVLENEIVEQNIHIGPVDPRNRDVTLSGMVRLEDCDCGATERSFTRRSREVFIGCRVSPDAPTAHFEIPNEELCADEVGLGIVGNCELIDDAGTVRVTGQAIFYEASAGSCGGDQREDVFDFEGTVQPRTLLTRRTQVPLYIRNLSNDGVCFFFGFPQDCDDSAEWHLFADPNPSLINEIAEF